MELIAGLPLIAGVMSGAVALGSSDAEGPLFDGAFGDEVIELQAELTLPPGERAVREERQGNASSGDSRAGDSGRGETEVPESDYTGPQEPGESSITQYCADDEGVIDQACQSIANLVDCVVVGPNSDPLDAAGSAAPFCLDETPEPVVDEAVIEAAVEVPDEDEGPDITEILEQIPGLVAEEFAALPIDGGSVEFEEELLGFGYINRHTNVFAEVDQQSFEQNMLGIDVEIRAVPVDYHFDYGDGTTRTTADPGQSATGGGAAITDLETPTSHVYQDTGLYDVAVTTTFTGEYRISGGAWTPIADSASISASPGEADIWRIQSRHVSGECEATSQWGCNGPFTLEGDDRPPTIFADQYDDAGNWRGP